jgi:archaemetzincin
MKLQRGQDRLFWWVTGAVSAVAAGLIVLIICAAPVVTDDHHERSSGQAAGGDPSGPQPGPPPGPQPGTASDDDTVRIEHVRHRITRDGATGRWRWTEAKTRLEGLKASSRFTPSARRKRQQVFAQVQGAEAFTRLGEPGPGDWLSSFREPGQTLEEYAREVVNRKVPGRETLHIQPYADLRFLQANVVGQVKRHTATFFDTKVKLLRPRRLDPAWFDRSRRQYDAGKVVAHLARKVPADSLGLFGLAGSDLYGLQLNFVFGMALLHHRAGVFSLHRYGTDQPALTRRALKLSAHELGHIFGLKHCVFYKCLMNGTNSLDEMDGQPVHLCPVCLAKLRWNLRFDVVARYKRLAALYRELGLKPEARFAAARARELEAK